ncbi:MAG: LamG domain-containing protein, partial [Candidatus Hinthialibacter sp.]
DDVSVDGDISDWDLTEDFFNYMYRAGDESKPVESKLYLQYDDEDDVLYTLVLAEEGVTVREQDDDTYVKIDGIKLVDGSFGDDEVPPDFEWVYDEGDNLIGWESSTPLTEGEYDLNVHTQVNDGESQTSAVANRNIPLKINMFREKPIILVIDEDSIDNGNEPNLFTDTEVNDDIANIGVRDILRYFKNHVGERITLFTGQVGDEGWYALKTIPDSWMKTGTLNDGVVNYLNAAPGLGTSGDGMEAETLLDAIPDVTPLRASGLKMLEGYMVCAVVYDSDVSVNYSPLMGSLKGANLGTVAFRVISVQSNYGYSDSTLPKVVIEILDYNNLKQMPMQLFSEAPVPASSSEPMDVNPIEPFTEDLVAYWDFNDGEGIVAQDRSPNAYNGVLINNPSWYNGYDLGGIALNGAGSYVDGGFFDVGSEKFSIMAWIKANQFNHLAESDARIVSKALGVNEDDHYWMLSTVDSGGPKLRFRLKTNGNTSTLTASSGNLEPGVWTHVAAVYDGGRMLLYKDGEEVGRMNKTGSLNVNY